MQNGRVEFSFMARNANPEVCPVGAMALWLFYTFQIFGCKPDFTARKTW